jgi:hypothetical protein
MKKYAQRNYVIDVIAKKTFQKMYIYKKTFIIVIPQKNPFFSNLINKNYEKIRAGMVKTEVYQHNSRGKYSDDIKSVSILGFQ